MDKFSYALGLGIGQNLLSMGASALNVDDFAHAVKDVLEGKKTEMTHAEAKEIVSKFFAELQDKAIKENKENGEIFLERNKEKPGVVVLPSGLQYEVIEKGHGRKPGKNGRVKCHYEGTLVNGMVFDSSYERKEPAVFGVSQVIPGWVEALQLMQEGDKWKLYIPSELAYGANGAGELIMPHSTLIFTVELLEVL